MYGFKATKADFKCHGFQYKMNKEFLHEGKLSMCNSGFHFCLNLIDTFKYYNSNDDRYFIIQYNDIISDKNKSVTNKIIFPEEIRADNIEYLLNSDKYGNLCNKNINGLLIYASRKGHTDIVKLLIKSGAYIHARDDYAFRCASENGHAEIVNLLIEKGANIHTKDDYALRWASANGHIDVVKLLIEKGADIHAEDDYALIWASNNGHIEIVNLLIERGADIHAEDDFALRWASEKGHTDIVKLLIENGANIHAKDDYALRWASAKGHTDVVKLLKSIP
jgi:ankyrin repeat protein